MKKRTTKKGWLLGLLVGLVMLVGAMPAMAGFYTLEGLYSGNTPGSTGDAVTINGVTYTAVKYDSGNTGSITYDGLNFNIFIGMGEYDTSDPSIDPVDGYQASSDSGTENNWVLTTTKNVSIDYFAVKGGNSYNLFQQTLPGNTDTGWLAPVKTNGNGAGMKALGVSHVTFYYKVNPVPIPGAVWLLSSGLGLLFIRRRRQG